MSDNLNSAVCIRIGIACDHTNIYMLSKNDSNDARKQCFDWLNKEK